MVIEQSLELVVYPLRFRGLLCFSFLEVRRQGLRNKEYKFTHPYFIHIPDALTLVSADYGQNINSGSESENENMQLPDPSYPCRPQKKRNSSK